MGEEVIGDDTGTGALKDDRKTKDTVNKAKLQLIKLIQETDAETLKPAIISFIENGATMRLKDFKGMMKELTKKHQKPGSQSTMLSNER
jgi:hypothetical protein